MSSSLTFYDASLGIFKGGLTTLVHILKKAQASPKASSLAEAKLIDDMKDLIFQVQIASDTANKGVWRLTGREIENWGMDEKTLEQLIARAEKSIALINSVSPKDIEGKEAATFEMGVGGGKTRSVSGKEYVLTYGIPNFFFHLTTAYGILRKEGIEIGKQDFLGGFSK